MPRRARFTIEGGIYHILNRKIIKDGLKERRREERYFREGAFGSREFVEEMKRKEK